MELYKDKNSKIFSEKKFLDYVLKNMYQMYQYQAPTMDTR